MLEITDPKNREQDVRAVARSLYWQGWRVSSIAKHLELKPSTVASWCRRDKWKDATPVERIEAAAETRMMVLIAKEKKDAADYKEIDLLGRQVERFARVRKYGETGKESDLNPNIDARNAGPKRKPSRNEISEEQHEKILTAFRDSLFDYQKVWYRNGDQRTRNILKSRQIGATWYFAREAFLDALDTGRNQIFLRRAKHRRTSSSSTSSSLLATPPASSSPAIRSCFLTAPPCISLGRTRAPLSRITEISTSMNISGFRSFAS